MGKFLFDNFSEARLVFEEASDVLGWDLKKLCFEGSESDLSLTEKTQPSLLTTSVATLRVLEQRFVTPTLVAGHSVGEYGALVAAKVLDFPSALKAVHLRGQLMQAAVPVGQGGMSAVLGLENDQVKELCYHVIEKSGFSPLSPANFNCPGQVVISGTMKALEWLRTDFKVTDLPESFWKGAEPKKIKIIPLQVSAPFHCKMMDSAEKKMREVLLSMTFRTASCGVIQNFHARLETDGDILRENLIRQISSAVLWTQSMEEALKKGVSEAIECGVGKTLTSLLKKISSSFNVFSTNSLEELGLIESNLKRGLS